MFLQLDPALSAQLKAIAGVNGGHFGGGGSMIRQESHQHEEEEKEPNFVDEEGKRLTVLYKIGAPTFNAFTTPNKLNVICNMEL